MTLQTEALDLGRCDTGTAAEASFYRQGYDEIA
jgi:hypothetical protein